MLNKLINRIHRKKRYPFDTLYAYKKETEFLALIFADHPNLGYYYAHIARHPNKQFWVSCLVYSSQFIIGQNTEQWLTNFDYWTRIRLSYEPVSNTIATYSYAESTDFSTAVNELEKMISQFNCEAIYVEDENEYPSNLEILDFYGTGNYSNENGEYPPIPQYNDRVFH